MVWSFRCGERPPKPAHLQRLIRAQKLQRYQASLKDDQRIPHNHAHCQRIRINVCGMVYETQRRTLERFPDTLLGNADMRIQYYDPIKQEYYFDRNRNAFEAILYFYQSGGRFRRPENVQADVLLEDAQFFRLSQAVIDQFRIEEGLSPPNSKHETVPQSLLRRKIWLLFDFPESSLQAAYVAILSIGALFLSIAVFCLDTMDEMNIKKEYKITDPKTGRIGIDPYSNIRDPLILTEMACNLWFLIEFLTRLICSPFYFKFLKSPLNLIDLIAIMPFLFSIVNPTTLNLTTEDDEPTNTGAESLYLLRIIRIVRLFRIFKLSRHSRGLKILGKTLKASLNELILLIFFIILGVILFSSSMYFAELDNPNTQFKSIPDGFWWAVITITTVGFGDIVPKTFFGKIVGSLCAVAGVLTIALPVPVIVSNFNFFYHQAIDEGDLMWINLNHVASCPFRPAGYNCGQQVKHEKKTRRMSTPTTYSSDEIFDSLKR